MRLVSRKLWVQFAAGATLVVAVAAVTTVVALEGDGNDLPGPGIVGERILDLEPSSGFDDLTSTEHLETTHVWAMDYKHPPRSDDQTIFIVATSDGYCVGTQHRPVGEHALAQESRASVLVSTPTVREFPARGGTCAGLGYVAPIRVSLTRPLGARAVVAPVKGGATRTIWPSEAQFQCIREVGGPIAEKRLDGATTRDQIRRFKQIPGLLRAEDKWGEGCGLHIDR
jgi:hypothetical protein